MVFARADLRMSAVIGPEYGFLGAKNVFLDGVQGRKLLSVPKFEESKAQMELEQKVKLAKSTKEAAQNAEECPESQVCPSTSTETSTLSSSDEDSLSREDKETERTKKKWEPSSPHPEGQKKRRKEDMEEDVKSEEGKGMPGP